MTDCLFCKIVAKEIPAKVAYEDEEVLAFHDIRPQAPLHILLISKKHLTGIREMSEGDISLIGQLVFRAKKIAETEKQASGGYRLVFNSGAHAGQSVFHVHLHLLAGRPMAWPPG